LIAIIGSFVTYKAEYIQDGYTELKERLSEIGYPEIIPTVIAALGYSLQDFKVVENIFLLPEPSGTQRLALKTETELGMLAKRV
jgi:hypothetical protein